MPGSSLWLLPPSEHPLNPILTDLIKQTSSHFNSQHNFLPHITLTSEISPSSYSSDAQAWLNSLNLPSGNDVQVQFEKLASEDVFVRKLYIQCAKTDGLKKLAGVCRREVERFGDESKAVQWANEKYNPHLSLLYHNCPPVEAEEISKIGGYVKQAGITISKRGILSGWTGGRVILVETDKPIDQWKPVAETYL